MTFICESNVTRTTIKIDFIFTDVKRVSKKCPSPKGQGDDDEMIRTRNAIERDDDEWNLNQNGMQAVRTVLSAV